MLYDLLMVHHGYLSLPLTTLMFLIFSFLFLQLWTSEEKDDDDDQ